MRLILIILFFCSGKLLFAQQYSGVNVNRIKGRTYKGATEFESYHQFSLGINLPRSLNYSGDVAWALKPAKGYRYKVLVPGIQGEYAYNWQRIAIHFRFMYERVEERLVKGNEILISDFDQNTYGIGMHYKWLYRARLRLYSGITLGSSIQWVRGPDYNNNFGSKSGYGSIQLIALGINYKFSNFGLFGEVGYGKKGLIYAGAFYTI
ncbi:MAG: hypothetical protein BGO31_20250 [Bacteroidetes bacterium 43-16]|nr:MAG: hypothetical protein BGO31_20250 [Bacteroidetes bacterium 43-16]